MREEADSKHLQDEFNKKNFDLEDGEINKDGEDGLPKEYMSDERSGDEAPDSDIEFDSIIEIQ